MTSQQITISLPEDMAEEFYAAHSHYQEVMNELFDCATDGDTKLWKSVVDAELSLASVFSDLADELDDSDPVATALELAAHVLAARADVGGSFIRADCAESAEREKAMYPRGQERAAAARASSTQLKDAVETVYEAQNG